jgi:putative ABC transport system permease protein
MMFNDNLQMAIASIRANRLRSILTLLGIIIGVVSVITSVSIGEGVKRQINTETNKLGLDVLSIRPGNIHERDGEGLVSNINSLSRSSQSASLSESDLEAIRKVNDINTVVPLSFVSGLPKSDTRDFKDGVVIGTTNSLPDMLQQEVEFGGFFDSNDEDSKVAVIGTRVAEKLFGEYAPLGETFSVRGQQFIVRGVFEKFDVGALSSGVDLNNALFIPYGTAKSIGGNNVQFYEILARLDNQNNTNNAIATITNELKKTRGGEQDFSILKANDSVASTNNVINLVTTMIIFIAIISMVVGGIGIMNITLVSVTERTREIGIRKAVGATNAQIGQQFLIEATMLSFWGAIIGVALAGVLNLILRIFTNMQPIIMWEVVAFASAVSIVIGIIFGAAPAYKAAKKDPIEALRS